MWRSDASFRLTRDTAARCPWRELGWEASILLQLSVSSLFQWYRSNSSESLSLHVVLSQSGRMKSQSARDIQWSSVNICFWSDQSIPYKPPRSSEASIGAMACTALVLRWFLLDPLLLIILWWHVSHMDLLVSIASNATAQLILSMGRLVSTIMQGEVLEAGRLKWRIWPSMRSWGVRVT